MSVTPVEGTWDLAIATPVGRIAAVIELHRRDGRLAGTARGAEEEVPLDAVTLDGDRLSWRQSVTRPFRLNLTFDVAVDGDALAGTSRAARLPASKVTGRRRTGSADTDADRG
ncbi:hypothetical protein ACFQ1I_06005 [Kitasatospora arboriphila]